MSAKRRMDETHGRDRPRAYGEAASSGAARPGRRAGVALSAAVVLALALLALIALAVAGGESTLVSALGAAAGAVALLAGATLAWALASVRREHAALLRR